MYCKIEDPFFGEIRRGGYLHQPKGNTIIGREITRPLAFEAGRNNFWLALFLPLGMGIDSDIAVYYFRREDRRRGSAGRSG